MKTIILFFFFSLSWALAQEDKPLRDPFLPVGYIPADEINESAEVKEEESLLDFGQLSPEEQELIRQNTSVGGVLAQGRSLFAVINGTVVQPGEILPLTVQGKLYRFRIAAITDNSIQLEPLRESEPTKATTGDLQ